MSGSDQPTMRTAVAANAPASLWDGPHGLTSEELLMLTKSHTRKSSQHVVLPGDGGNLSAS